jgi:hypothetical protein
MLNIRLSEVAPVPGSPAHDRRVARACVDHPGSPVRPQRTLGPNGPDVYPQCVPRNGEPPHLLVWLNASSSHRQSADSASRLAPPRAPSSMP